MSRIPLEFVLLRQIIRAFPEREWPGGWPAGWTVVSKSQITRRFLFKRKGDPLTSQDFYHRVLPGWIARGLARELSIPGKQPHFGFRAMSLNEINARFLAVEREAHRLLALHNDPTKPEYNQPGIMAAISYAGSEMRALLIERKVVFDEAVTVAAVLSPVQPPKKA